MAKTIPPLVSVDWLKENLDNPRLVILDATLKKPGGVAPPIDNNLRIPNTRFFDIKKKFSNLNNELPNTLPDPEAFENAAQDLGVNKDSLIVVYDRWGIYSSPRAWWMFNIMGHDQVAVLDGGLPAWQTAGYQCTTESPNYTAPGNFKATFQPEKIKYISDIADNLQNQKLLVIDARSKGRFDATSPEPRVELRGGHIPGSKSLPFTEVLNQDGKMKTAEALKSIFQGLNPMNQAMTCSCGSGITASVIYLAAYIAGQRDLSLYDGSWTEYAQKTDLPVEK